MQKDSRFKDMRLTLFFISIMIIVSFYFINIFSVDHMFGDHVENFRFPFIFNLKNPWDFWGVNILTHFMAHASWKHFISNAIFFIPFGAVLEKELKWKNYLTFIIFTQVLTSFILLISFKITHQTSLNYVLGSSSITIAFITLTALDKKNLFIGLLALLAVLIDYFIVNNNFALIGHLAGATSAGLIYLYKRKKGKKDAK